MFQEVHFRNGRGESISIMTGPATCQLTTCIRCVTWPTCIMVGTQLNGSPKSQAWRVIIRVIKYMCWLVGISAGASEENRATTSPVINSGRVHLPFQLQINYTDQDGSQCMQVSTIAKPVTSNKKTASIGEFNATVGTHSNTALLYRSASCYIPSTCRNMM